MSEQTQDLIIQDEQQYRQFKETLSRHKRPPLVLRLMMQALEAYRSARKLGWSRPWNKYDLMNFQSFRLKAARDARLLTLAAELLRTECANMPAEAREFCDELLGDRDHLMGFLFVHEFSEQGRHFEGATLSLGRVNDRRYRDRLDIILESPVEAESGTGLGRLRVFVDPFRGVAAPLWRTSVEPVGSGAATELFDLLSDASWDWADQPERLWDHWTSAYIDYFGPRRWPMRRSHFHVQGRPQARIPAGAEQPLRAAAG
jgi:hypothetical protein